MAYGNQTLGRGEVHFSRFKTGGGGYVPEGFRYLGNTPSYALTIGSSKLDHFNSDRGIRTKDKSIVIETTVTGKFDADDIQYESLAWFFFGTAATVTQTSATSATETFTGVIAGLSYQIGLTDALPGGVKGVSNVVVTVSSTAKTAGVDYLVDPDRGVITIVEGGTITSGANVLVTYDRLARSYKQVISGTQQVSGAMQFRSYNPEGEKIDFYLPYVSLSPNGDFALKADQAWQSLPFNVEILNAPGRAAIYANGQPYSVS
jgi:hypothetical protein